MQRGRAQQGLGEEGVVRRDKQEVRREGIASVTDINCKGTKKAFRRQMKHGELAGGDRVRVLRGKLAGVPNLAMDGARISPGGNE